MKTPHHPSTIDTATLREIARTYRDPRGPVEGLLLHGAETELQRRQDEAPSVDRECRKATASEMHP